MEKISYINYNRLVKIHHKNIQSNFPPKMSDSEYYTQTATGENTTAYIYTDKIFNEKLKLQIPQGYPFLFPGEGKNGAALGDHEMITPFVNIVIRDDFRQEFFFKYESLEQLLETAELPKCQHEVIFGWMKQRPKFDMDAGDANDFDSVLEYIEAAFYETYDLAPEFVVCDSSDEKKFRRHIIISNYAFDNSAEAKHFSDEILKPAMGDFARCLDWGVNKKTQNFRTVGSTKEGRTKKVIRGDEKDVWITLCKDVPTLPLIAPPEARKEFPTTLPGNVNWDLIKERVDGNIWTLNKRQSEGNRLLFNRRRPSICPICNRQHESSDMFICVFENSIRQFCYRDTNEPKKSILLWEKPKDKFSAGNITDRDHKVYFAQYTQFLNNVYEDTTPIKQFVIDTIAYIVDGGNSFYVTKNSDNGMSFTIVKDLIIRGGFSIRKGSKPEWKNFRNFLIELHDDISYDKIVFIPYLHNPPITEGKAFNMFTGFKHAFDTNFTVDESRFDLITKHIDNIWCKNNREVIDYVYNWMAHIIQFPTVKMGKAILLKSQAQGAGKNSVCEFFGNCVLGSRYVCCIDDIDNLIGRFNAHLENKLFTICDEIQNYGGAYKSNDKLKSIITRREMGVESKGLNIRRADDLNNYIFLTNNDWALKIEGTDRRYLALELDNTQANNREYFNALYAQINDENAAIHFFHWLANRDIKGWNPDYIPETDLKRELKLNSVPAGAKFLIDIANGELNEKLGVVEGNIKIFTDTLYAHFRDWLAASGERTDVSKEMFSKQIGKIIKSKTIRIGVNRKMGFELNTENLKLILMDHLRLPDLFEQVDRTL